ncbi:glycosyltransferase family 4 protein [Paenibacillus sp. FSL H8-0079]|uniref:glycosyltransferase family 4 protein n=1 Tax=Paenibacillus sp. FSL H8-0079 TaxID=2921375 RepID=UPI0030EC852F
MMKPKVLVIGSSTKDMGGIVSVIVNIENSLIAEQYHLQRIETYITGSVLARLIIFIKGFLQFLVKLVTFKPDMIHIHMSYNGSFYRKALFIFVGRKIFRVPVIVHIHASSFDVFYNRHPLQQKLCKYVLNQVDKLIVLSYTWKSFFSRIVPESKIEVLYNGVFIKEPPVREERQVPRCLFMGRLGKRKGVYDLLLAIQLLKKRGVEAVFTLAGDGEVNEVRALVERYGITEYVEVPGWIRGEEKERLLHHADLLVLPSYHEGLPMAILEAMNEGLPIVSTRVGGIPEVITDELNGFLVEPGDVAEMVHVLERLILDKELRVQMGLNNKELVTSKFNMNSLIENLSSIYDKVHMKVS